MIDQKSLKWIFKGLKIALLIVVLLNLLQIAYLYFNLQSLRPILEISSKYIEARWGSEIPGEVHRFYIEGSYVETTKRINGISEEASVNALVIFLGFMPFLLASIKNRFNIFDNKSLGNLNFLCIYILTLVLIIILVLIRSSLGLILSIISMYFLIRFSPRKTKIILTPLVFIGIGLILYYIWVEYYFVINFYISKIVDLSVPSTQNRIGIPLASILSFSDNPLTLIFGIGRGANNFYDLWIYTHLPNWVDNFEIPYFLSMHFPRPVFLITFLFEYGFIVYLLVFLFTTKIFFHLNDFKMICINRQYKTYIEYLQIFIIFCFIVSLANFNPFKNSFFWFLVIFNFKLYKIIEKHCRNAIMSK